MAIDTFEWLWTNIVSSVSTNTGKFTTVGDLFSVDLLVVLSGFS